jgi:DNA repair and recombination protein RAD54B
MLASFQFILRRTQEIISKYLPPKVEWVLFCPPSAAQTFIYENMVS